MDKEIIINKFIKKKRLTYEELEYFFNGYLNMQVTDLEMTRVLKAICKHELRYDEVLSLVDIFIKSGNTYDLSNIEPLVDKHSTGGVGDKTTLIIGPIIASCDVKLAKLSGKALGYTGGTIDKLNSINVNTDLTYEEFIKNINDINISIMGASKTLCPMDKKVYALRDITGTTRSISLIAISIMSKKIASGASKILIDIKVGKGALIRNKKDGVKLAKLMIKIGKHYNKKVICMLTKMDNPLGSNIGNTIEILEVLDILNNKKENNLSKLSIEMSSLLISMGKNISIKDAKKEVINSLTNKNAFNKFKEFVKRQNGNLNIKLPKGIDILSKEEGYLKSINSLILGNLSMELGAGRIRKEDEIDYNAGIILHKNIGDYVKKDEVICTIYGNKKIDIDNLYKAFTYSKKLIKQDNIIIKIIK